VDTGSVYSIIPHSLPEPPSGPAIMTADRTTIPCWGHSETVVSSGSRSFRWNFLLAGVAFPILGADFLGAFDLKVNVRKMQLESGKDRWTVQLAAPPPGSTFAAIGVAPATERVVCPQTKIRPPVSAGESEKRSLHSGLAPHFVPRIPQAGEGKVVTTKVLKSHSLSGEGRAHPRRKPSYSGSKEYRDFLSKRRPVFLQSSTPARSCQQLLTTCFIVLKLKVTRWPASIAVWILRG